MTALQTFVQELAPWVDRALNKNLYWGNTPFEWISFGVVALVVALGARMFKAVTVRHLKKLVVRNSTSIDDITLEAFDETRALFFLVVGLYAGSLVLNTNESVRSAINVTLVIALLVQGGLWAQTLFGRFAARWSEKRSGNHANTVAAGLTFLARLTIWSFVVLMVLANLGVEVGAVMAGLGIGGVAAALALQNILGDVFASLSMYFDRPFDIGDFVIVGDVIGHAENIGIRTTRIRSLGGEQIIVPNGDLIKSRIRNYARMNERRIMFHLAIEYNLPYTKVERAAQIAEEVINDLEGVRFDRAHFKEYGAYSLNYEVVYYVLSREYGVYMQCQHQINLEIYRRFEAAGIPFAFPSRTIYHRSEADAEALPESHSGLRRSPGSSPTQAPRAGPR